MRDQRLDILARGYNCPTCKATPDEPCQTRRCGNYTQPHTARIDRAVAAYHKAMQAR